MLRRLAVLAALLLLVGAPPASAAPPAIDAASYLVVDPATGESLAERAPDRVLPMASTTKIMTALIALEEADLDDRLAVPPDAAVGGSTGELVPGERVRVRHLLTALLVASGNDAAITLAVGIAGSQAAFVERMNARARELGLEDTRFANPHGLDAPGHHSSVRDLVLLARVAMARPEVRERVALGRARIPGPAGRGARTYLSRNGLLRLDPEADGVKTGMTDGAGFAIVAHSRREALGVDLYAAIIGSPSEEARARDADRLLSWGFAQYARPVLVRAGVEYASAAVQERPGARVPLVARGGLRVPVRIGRPVTETVVAPPQVKGPVRSGEAVGTVTLRQGERVLGRRALVAARDAGAPGFLDRVRTVLGGVLP